jgi:hypothetical protein
VPKIILSVNRINGPLKMVVFMKPILFTNAILLMAASVALSAPMTGEISLKKATQIALAKVGGKIKSSEYEFERGQNVYSFDISGTDGKIHEILVSAKNGNIISSTIESADKEAAEKKADENFQIQ